MFSFIFFHLLLFCFFSFPFLLSSFLFLPASIYFFFSLLFLSLVSFSFPYFSLFSFHFFPFLFFPFLFFSFFFFSFFFFPLFSFLFPSLFFLFLFITSLWLSLLFYFIFLFFYFHFLSFFSFLFFSVVRLIPHSTHGPFHIHVVKHADVDWILTAVTAVFCFVIQVSWNLHSLYPISTFFSLSVCLKSLKSDLASEIHKQSHCQLYVDTCIWTSRSYDVYYDLHLYRG